MTSNSPGTGGACSRKHTPPFRVGFLILEKAVYIATAGAISFMIDSTRITNYIIGGIRLEPTVLQGLLIFIPVSLVGVMIGRRGVEKIPQGKFRNFIAIFIFLLGLKLVLFP